MNRRIIIGVSVICMMFLLTLTDCDGNQSSLSANSTASTANEESTASTEKLTEVTSSDGKVKVSIPASWKEENLENEDAIIQLSSVKDDAYTMIVIEKKQDYDASTKLANYQQIIQDAMVETLGGYEAVEKIEPKSFKVNEYESIQCYLEGSFEGFKVKYALTCIETANHFMQVVSWSTPNRFDVIKNDFDKILNSVKVIE
ncbi:MAG: hypothetical protein ACYDG2_00650 [Ruminiclostridium sp.]